MDELLPKAMAAGVSYSDVWEMTPKELYAVINAEQDKSLRYEAFGAYSTGSFFHCKYMPGSIVKTFPGLFGRTGDGQIKAENWRESYAAMEDLRRRFIAQKHSKVG